MECEIKNYLFKLTYMKLLNPNKTVIQRGKTCHHETLRLMDNLL